MDIVWAALRALAGLLLAILRAFGAFWAALFGPLRWQPPAWWSRFRDLMRAAAGHARARPRQYLRAGGALLLLALVGFAGWRWWENLPRPLPPLDVHFAVEAPEATDYSQTPRVVHPLRVHFDASSAALALVGKTVSTGITMQPALAGRWQFIDDQTLQFDPAGEWPVGQHYRVEMDRSTLFAPQVRVLDDDFAFDSPAFSAEVRSVEFYQDPQDARLKKAIAQLHFSHPADALAFEQRVSVWLGEHGKDKPKPVKQKFAVSWDDDHLNAWVHSQPLELPLDPGFVQVRIDAGLRAAAGGRPLAEPLQGEVTVPGKYSLAITRVEPTLVDDARGESEQVLLVEVSQSVGEGAIRERMHAWLLPELHPQQRPEQRKQRYHWGGSAGSMSEQILTQARRLDLDPVAAELEHQPLHSFRFKADPGRWLYVRVDKGLTSFGGFVLGKPAAFVVRVPDYPRMLRFMAEGALLSLRGEQKVAVVARNVPGLKLDIGRVLPEQLANLVAFNYGAYARPELGALSPDQISERFEQTLSFDDDHTPGRAHYEGLDLSAYLGTGRRGVFLLALRDYDPKAELRRQQAERERANAREAFRAADLSVQTDAGEPYVYDRYHEGLRDTRLVVVTDLGLLLKKAMDGSLDVFVQSLHDGVPVAGARIEVLGKNGQSLLSAASDTQGHAHFPPLDGFVREQTPSVLVARNGEDLSFLPLKAGDRALDTSRFDVGGIRNTESSGQLGAWLFSDRGLYRPGDTFHVGMIVRPLDWQRSIQGLPLQVEVFDARGLRVHRQSLRLGAEGFEEIELHTDEAAPTGTWTVALSLVQSGNQVQRLGSTSIQIKEFLPDRMKASAYLSSPVGEGWVKPGGLSARVNLQNLFGTPATERRVEASLTLTPAFPAFASWPGYHFYDPQRAKEGYTETLQAQSTDANGDARFALDLGKYARATYRLLLVARGFEAEGGRSVGAEVASLVSDRDYLVGLRADDRLDYVKRDERRQIALVAVDPTLKAIAVDGLKTVLVERRWVSVLIRQDSGVYKYESKLKEVPLREAPLALAADANTLALDTATPGEYALLVKNAAGEELNRVQYSVAGAANLSRSLERNAELQLSLDRRDYAPGEEIEISVRAPYAGAGLISIERDKVYAWRWFKADSSASVQRIRVPAGFAGNGYVSVQYLRDPASAEIFMSPLSHAIVPFSVSRAGHRLELGLRAPERIKPGQTLRMQVQTASPARVAVFAVDEGILQVAGYRLGDPLDHFLQKRMLQVRSSQILDLLLPEFAQLLAAAAPGGDADKLIGRHLNPFRKKRAAPVAWWSGLRDVDAEQSFDNPVPEDFNGRLRIMAVAVSGARMAVREIASSVRGDFVLSPNAPAMVAPGDRFEVSVGVANNVEGGGDVVMPIKVSIDPGKGFELLSAAEQSLSLAPMREGVLRFSLRARGEPGAGRLRFAASSGDYAAAIGADVSVRPAQTFRNSLHVGIVRDGSTRIADLRDLYPQFAQNAAAASYSPLVLAGGLSGYLDAFPHQCTEQVVSKAMPGLVLAEHPEFGKLWQPGGKHARSGFADLIALLRSRQNGEGGFGYWSAELDVQPYVTAYVVQFLLEARERGWPVPQDMLERANVYLQRLSMDESDGSPDGLRERAFAIYLLTRQQQVTSNAIAAVRERLDAGHGEGWHKDATAAYLAASLKLLKLDREAERLIEGPQSVLVRDGDVLKDAWWIGRFFDPLVNDATTLYLLDRHFPERTRALPPAALGNLLKVMQAGRYNSLSAALTVLALGDYSERAAAEGGERLHIEHEDAEGKASAIDTADGLIRRALFAPGGKALWVRNEADLPAWYSVSQSGYDRAPPANAVSDGIEIVRELRNLDGKVVDAVRLGEEIEVHLKVRATAGEGWGNVAIIDLLPGGFEPVQQSTAAGPAAGTPQAHGWQSSIALDSSNFALDYAEVRDDRVLIYGWVGTRVSQFVYRIKATNVGEFVLPPAYAEAMYERTVQARAPGGRIEVVRP